jgi:hypothetical protein
MALDQSWATCSAQCVGRLWTNGVTIDAGMSGSPIVRDDGAAIGLQRESRSAAQVCAGPTGLAVY